MAKKAGNESDSLYDDHELAEEIDVEVKKLLRTQMASSDLLARELTDKEQEIFAESFLGSTVEELIPTPKQELLLMESHVGLVKQGRGSRQKKRIKASGGQQRKGSVGKKSKQKRRKKGKK